MLWRHKNVCELNCLLLHHVNWCMLSVCFLLRMHHLCALLGPYSPYLLMSLKMQIKASRVVNSNGIK